MNKSADHLEVEAEAVLAAVEEDTEDEVAAADMVAEEIETTEAEIVAVAAVAVTDQDTKPLK
jgi:predicted TIM-barrel fold metal-dependent hydrolase